MPTAFIKSVAADGVLVAAPLSLAAQVSLGADTLNGAGGADVFLYGAANHSTNAERDIVVGFETGIDKVDLRPFYNAATDSFAITPGAPSRSSAWTSARTGR